ncbi:YPDG domain-containing protein, partial [Staphylococcus pseudintermedius]|uniref:YPDG domain-containing protein n=1 Tax=Staphylococcus pseudintermedius TaxID=283734 RepID=UPI000E364057
EIPQTGDKDLSPNSKFEIPPSGDIQGEWKAEVDPNTGVVTVTPPADANPGTSVEIPVNVTFPDGAS